MSLRDVVVACALTLSVGCAHTVVHGPPRAERPTVTVLRTRAPVQLPRVVSAGEGWGLVWSHAPPTIDVHGALLSPSLTLGRVHTLSPRDAHSSAFAVAAPRSADVWAAVYTDDVTAPHRAQHGRFARVDFGTDDAHHTALRALDPSQPAGAAVLAYNPQRARWGVLALDRAVTFSTVDDAGRARDPAAPFAGAALSPSTDATPLVADGDRWAAVLRGPAALRVARFDDAALEPAWIDLAPVPMRDVTGATLDRDDTGLGVAWTAPDGLWFARVARDRVAVGPVHLSDARNAHAPALAWNGRHHVLAWAETDTGHTIRAAVLDARGATLRAFTLAEGEGDEDFVTSPTVAARGDGSGAVAVLWQRGQTTVEGRVLAP